MKISLTTDPDCRQTFVKADGGVFAFPGQDFQPIGPSNKTKCNRIYVGPDIIDALKCEISSQNLSSPSSDIWSHVGSGVDSISPPPSSPIIGPGCICDVRTAWLGQVGNGWPLEVRNMGTCDLMFSAHVDPRVTIGLVGTQYHLPPNGVVNLTVGSNDPILDPPDIEPDVTIATDKCGTTILQWEG